MNPKTLYSNFKKSIAPFMELTRAYSLLTSVAPWFLAASCAVVSPIFYEATPIYIFHLILTFITVICGHLGGNLFDDYIDVLLKLKKGIPLNQIDFENGKGKAKLIINGTYTLKQVLKRIIILFTIPVLIGIYFTFLYGAVIPVIAGVTAALCLFYPFASKLYLGEAVIGTIFGPLIIMGTYLALTAILPSKIIILSIACGFVIMVLLDAHSLMDYDYDKKTGKRTLCTLAGSKTDALVVIALEMLIAYGIIIYLVATKAFSPFILLSVLFTAPLTVKLIKSLDDYNKVKDLKFIPKWYLGPMENWEQIQKEHYEYFMYRFYIARNIGLIFCITIAFVCYFTIKTVQHYV